MIFSRTVLIILYFAICAGLTHAQDRPVGYWRSHLPYNSALGVATDGNSVYTISNQAFYIKDVLHNLSPVPYSKVEGMSDIGMQCIAYDKATATTVLVYANGNIDLFKEKENTFYNIPDLKIKSVSGSKTVNQVYTENGIAYICTSIGILVLDLVTHNIDENYKFYVNNQIIPVQGFTRNGNYFYAITSSGLYRADKNSPQLQNFQVWELMDTIKTYKCIVSINSKLFLSDQKSVYGIVNDTVRTFYTCTDINNAIIQHIDAGNVALLISEFYSSTYSGAVKVMDANFNIVDSYARQIGNPMQAVQLLDNTIWIADAYYGLASITATVTQRHVPAGPSGIGTFDIYAYNKNLWVAHGGFNDEYSAIASLNGVSNFYNEDWTPYVRYAYPPFNNMDAFVALVRDEKSGTMYMGSYLNGLFILNKDGSYEALNKNSIFDTSTAYFGQDQRQVVGLALDESRNLWVATAYSHDQLYARDPDGNWFKFYVPGVPSAGPVATDDRGQVWFVGYGSQGIVAYNPNGTVSDKSDDVFYHFTAGVGSGNLPSNKVYCLAKDKNNNMWVGTDNGIGIISSCTATNSSPVCDAQIPIVQYDQFAGYLFAGNNVRTIAVDGANRKWVGTDDGIWLLSPSADRIIYRFTVDNSPMPSNHVRKIAIDPVTGDVYVGTDAGLVSYRSTATDAAVADSKGQIFPNPVASTYSGSIAIKGLAANSDVRITDIDGKLVYSTKAFGGQAVWNGMDYTGHRPQSGVYLVFASSSDGSQTYTGKIVFMK